MTGTTLVVVVCAAAVVGNVLGVMVVVGAMAFILPHSNLIMTISSVNELYYIV